jgi:hypothetical protein
MKLSKGTPLPPSLSLFSCGVIDVGFLVFLKNLFISDEKEGFDSDIDDVTLTANSIVYRIVPKTEFSSYSVGMMRLS